MTSSLPEPSKSQLRIMREMEALEHLGPDETTFIRADDAAAEECVEQGWLKSPLERHKYRLTSAGRDVLARYDGVDL